MSGGPCPRKRLYHTIWYSVRSLSVVLVVEASGCWLLSVR